MKIWNLEARPDLAHIRLLINNASPIRVSPSPLLARRALEGKVSPWMHLGPTSLRFTEDTVVISPAYPFQSHLANTNSILDYAPSFVFVSFFKTLSLWVAEIECFLFWVLCYGLLSAPWYWFSFLSLQGKIKELEEFFNFNFNFVLFFVNYVCGVWFFIIYLFDHGCADIKSGHVYIGGEEGYRQDSDLQKAKVSREGSSPNWLSLVLLQGLCFFWHFPVIILKPSSSLTNHSNQWQIMVWSVWFRKSYVGIAWMTTILNPKP